MCRRRTFAGQSWLRSSSYKMTLKTCKLSAGVMKYDLSGHLGHSTWITQISSQETCTSISTNSSWKAQFWFVLIFNTFNQPISFLFRITKARAFMMKIRDNLNQIDGFQKSLRLMLDSQSHVKQIYLSRVEQHPEGGRETGERRRGGGNAPRATALVSSNHWRWLAATSGAKQSNHADCKVHPWATSEKSLLFMAAEVLECTNALIPRCRKTRRKHACKRKSGKKNTINT